MDDQVVKSALDDPSLARHLSAEMRELMRRADDEDAEARAQLLPVAAAICDAFAELGLLEYAYLPLVEGESDDDEGPVAWMDVDEAQVDADRDAVVLSGSTVVAIYDGPITLDLDDEDEAAGEG